MPGRRRPSGRRASSGPSTVESGGCAASIRSLGSTATPPAGSVRRLMWVCSISSSASRGPGRRGSGATTPGTAATTCGSSAPGELGQVGERILGVATRVCEADERHVGIRSRRGEVQHASATSDRDRLAVLRVRRHQVGLARAGDPADHHQHEVALRGVDQPGVGVGGRAGDRDQVGALAGLERADRRVPAEHLRRPSTSPSRRARGR